MAREKILVLDDDVLWLRTIDVLLQEHYDLTLTSEADKAIEHVIATAFPLAILDQRLPNGVSGAELSVQLRQIRPELRVIILTGYAALDDAVVSLRTGVVDYLGKDRADLATELPLRIAKALADVGRETPILALLRKGEGHDLEFKSSARWDIRQKKTNKDLETVILKTVSAFLNSEGGVLLIGVDDDGNAIGLENDYKTLKNPGRDGYEVFITGLLLGTYGNDLSRYIRVDFHDVDGRDICRVDAGPAPKPIFIPDGKGDEHLYIRAGNTTRQLSTRQALDYCKQRW
jgi:ActR/RegA family two-component response regulator